MEKVFVKLKDATGSFNDPSQKRDVSGYAVAQMYRTVAVNMAINRGVLVITDQEDFDASNAARVASGSSPYLLIADPEPQVKNPEKPDNSALFEIGSTVKTEPDVEVVLGAEPTEELPTEESKPAVKKKK